MFCVQCGTRINEGERFCTRCGTKAPEPAPVATGAVVQPVAAPSASHAAAVTGSLDSSELQAMPVAGDAPAHVVEPAPSFKMFGVEMGEHPEEHGNIAPSSGD